MEARPGSVTLLPGCDIGVVVGTGLTEVLVLPVWLGGVVPWTGELGEEEGCLVLLLRQRRKQSLQFGGQSVLGTVVLPVALGKRPKAGGCVPGDDVLTAPAAPGGLVLSVPADCVVPGIPKFPETDVVGCWEVMGLAAEVVLGVGVLCDEFFCPDVEVGMDVVSSFEELFCVTVVGEAAPRDSDVPRLAVVPLL